MLNDAFLWYNVGDWADYGLAVPNVGDDIETQNTTIKKLFETMGRHLFDVMWHHDAASSAPPSVNTVERICKLCVRARDIVAARAVPPGKFRLEPSHAAPAPEQFRVYPTPYFKVRNTWLQEYAGLALLCMTEMAQHQENSTPLEISTNFGEIVGGYVHRIYRLVGIELLNLPPVTFDKLDYTITDEQIRAYNPGVYYTSTEMTDTVPTSVRNRPTEDDLKPLAEGIPWSFLPLLGRHPSAGGNGSLANSGDGTSSGTNGGNSSFLVR